MTEPNNETHLIQKLEAGYPLTRVERAQVVRILARSKVERVQPRIFGDGMTEQQAHDATARAAITGPFCDKVMRHAFAIGDRVDGVTLADVAMDLYQRGELTADEWTCDWRCLGGVATRRLFRRAFAKIGERKQALPLRNGNARMRPVYRLRDEIA